MADETPDEAVVRKTLELFGSLRIDEALTYVSDDLLLELPFRHDGSANVLRGPAALGFIRAMPRLFAKMDFTDITVHGRTASGVVAAEYRSNGLTHQGEPYPNRYAAFFDVEDGKIVRWREYYDPVVIARTFKMKLE